MSNSKKALISLILVIAVVFSFAVALKDSRHKINVLEEKLEEKEMEAVKIEEDLGKQISILTKTVNELEKKKKEAEETLKQVKKSLNIDGLTLEELKKVGEISYNTPIDLKTSAVLVNVAKKYNLKPSLILSIMELESNFKKYEVGVAQDRGYMQIIPSTEKWLANEFADVHKLSYNPSRIFEPEYNIELAAVYLSLLKKSYGDDYNRILSEYNRGPYNLAKYYKENKTYSTTYSKVILAKEKKYLSFND